MPVQKYSRNLLKAPRIIQLSSSSSRNLPAFRIAPMLHRKAIIYIFFPSQENRMQQCVDILDAMQRLMTTVCQMIYQHLVIEINTITHQEMSSIKKISKTIGTN